MSQISNNQIKSLAEEITNNLIVCSSVKIADIITNWFLFNPIEPVAVGLTDEQVVSFVDSFFINPIYTEELTKSLKGWLKTQTFVQFVEFSNVELSEMYQALMEDFQDLQKELGQLKTQFTPDWSTAPEGVNWVAQEPNGGWSWFINKPYIHKSDKWVSDSEWAKNATPCRHWRETLQQRPTSPTPKVEVGQVWAYIETGVEYVIDEIIVLNGNTKIGEWQENFTLVTYSLNALSGYKPKDIYRRPMSDFLAKFERVHL